MPLAKWWIDTQNKSQETQRHFVQQLLLKKMLMKQFEQLNKN